MSAATEIAELDATLAEDGMDIVLRKVTGNSTSTKVFNDVTCRAFVTPGYTPEELVGAITQQYYSVVLSPTQINAAQWPGGVPVPTAQYPVDERVPSKNRGDQVIFVDCGKVTSVDSAKPIYIDGELIRIDMRCLG